MSATTSELSPRGAAERWLLLLVAGLALAAAAGLGRVTVEPDAPFVGESESPLEVADRALRATTGGDDLVVVVLRDSRGPMGPDSVAAVDGVYEALTAEPALARSRSFTRAPILASDEGMITASTPLHPLPSGPAFASARARVLADPFAGGTLVTPDGTLALLPSWIHRPSPDDALVGIASAALQDEAIRATDEGKAARQAIDAARLAVVLGDRAGPADVEVARRLRELAEGDNALVRGWLDQVSALVDDPESAALEAARRALVSVTLPAGVHGGVLGEAAVRGELAAAFPLAVALALAGILLGLGGVLGVAEGVAAAARATLAGGIGAAAVAGGLGWVGAPMHSWTALAPIAGAALAGLAASQSPSVNRILGALMPVGGLALGLRHGPGATAAWLLVVVVTLGAAALPTGRSPGRPLDRMPVASRPWMGACGLTLVALSVVVPRPLGMDPGRQLRRSHPIGSLMAALDAYGMATPAQIALEGEGARALARPEALRTLRSAQDELEAREEVAGTVSWADFVAALHAAGSGADGLPGDPALVDQYLLLFGRPDEVRPLVAEDLSVGGGILRLAPGQGARLGPLAGPVGEGVLITGGAARVARAGWLAARGALWAVLGLMLGFGWLAVRDRGVTETGLAGAAGSAGALAVCSLAAGSLGVEAFVAGAIVWAMTLLGGGRAALVGVGAALALMSPVVIVGSLGLGVASGATFVAALSGPFER